MVNGRLTHTDVVNDVNAARLTVNELAQSYLDREDEDWTYVDPEDIKRLARAVLNK